MIGLGSVPLVGKTTGSSALSPCAVSPGEFQGDDCGISWRKLLPVSEYGSTCLPGRGATSDRSVEHAVALPDSRDLEEQQGHEVAEEGVPARERRMGGRTEWRCQSRTQERWPHALEMSLVIRIRDIADRKPAVDELDRPGKARACSHR